MNVSTPPTFRLNFSIAAQVSRLPPFSIPRKVHPLRLARKISLRLKVMNSASHTPPADSQGEDDVSSQAIVASSSSSERNWSTYAFIHSQKRNKLAAKKAEELVYVHSNLCILSHMQSNYREGPTKHWDVRAEDIDSDASLSHHSLLDIEDLDSPSQPNDVDASASGSGSVTAIACGSNELHVDVDASDEDIEEEY